MNNTCKKLMYKGQLNSCPLLFKAIVVIFLFLPACSKQQSSTEIDQSQEHESIDIKKVDFKSLACQAKNFDLAVPVGYKLIKENVKSCDNNFFVYEGRQSVGAVVIFYIKNLEVSGWEFKNLSTKQEGLFVCSKPGKTCVVSIRPEGLCNSVICITMANNERNSVDSSVDNFEHNKMNGAL